MKDDFRKTKDIEETSAEREEFDNAGRGSASASGEAAEAGGKAGDDESPADARDFAADGTDTPSEETPAAADTENAAKDVKDSLIEELKDKHLRLFAEFDNFRKRSETEKKAMFEEGEKAVLLKVLPLVDNFERALGNLPDDEKETPFAEGIEKTYRAFMDGLKELGVTPIEACGRPFDANFHNAVMHTEDESAGENTVTEEFQKGYMLGDKVLRYSMVKVAN